MAPGGPSNLKQKCNFVYRQSLFIGLLNKERVTGDQDETPQKGGPNTLPTNQNSRYPKNHLTSGSVNNLSNLASLPSQASEPVRETSQISSTESVLHASSEDAAATVTYILLLDVAGWRPFVKSRELGEPCDRIYLYERTHSTQKDGWKSLQTKENWEMMKK